MRLKRWESPRRAGRNDKGRGGSARQRQLKKQQQMLRKKLKDDSRESQVNKFTRGEKDFSPFAFIVNSNKNETNVGWALPIFFAKVSQTYWKRL